MTANNYKYLLNRLETEPYSKGLFISIRSHLKHFLISEDDYAKTLFLIHKYTNLDFEKLGYPLVKPNDSDKYKKIVARVLMNTQQQAEKFLSTPVNSKLFETFLSVKDFIDTESIHTSMFSEEQKIILIRLKDGVGIDCFDTSQHIDRCGLLALHRKTKNIKLNSLNIKDPWIKEMRDDLAQGHMEMKFPEDLSFIFELGTDNELKDHLYHSLLSSSECYNYGFPTNELVTRRLPWESWVASLPNDRFKTGLIVEELSISPLGVPKRAIKQLKVKLNKLLENKSFQERFEILQMCMVNMEYSIISSLMLIRITNSSFNEICETPTSKLCGKIIDLICPELKVVIDLITSLDLNTVEEVRCLLDDLDIVDIKEETLPNLDCNFE